MKKQTERIQAIDWSGRRWSTTESNNAFVGERRHARLRSFPAHSRCADFGSTLGLRRLHRDRQEFGHAVGSRNAAKSSRRPTPARFFRARFGTPGPACRCSFWGQQFEDVWPCSRYKSSRSGTRTNWLHVGAEQTLLAGDQKFHW